MLKLTCQRSTRYFVCAFISYSHLVSACCISSLICVAFVAAAGITSFVPIDPSCLLHTLRVCRWTPFTSFTVVFSCSAHVLLVQSVCTFCCITGALSFNRQYDSLFSFRSYSNFTLNVAHFPMHCAVGPFRRCECSEMAPFWLGDYSDVYYCAEI